MRAIQTKLRFARQENLRSIFENRSFSLDGLHSGGP
jgi:hypothetical protein